MSYQVGVGTYLPYLPFMCFVAGVVVGNRPGPAKSCS